MDLKNKTPITVEEMKSVNAVKANTAPFGVWIHARNILNVAEKMALRIEKMDAEIAELKKRKT
jgi:hypothetical protein